jgi:hypothetical protein
LFSGSLHIPLNQLYRLAAHLHHWHKARILDTLSDFYVYVVSPTIRVPICFGSVLSDEFLLRFPTQNLPEVMSRFCVHCKLCEHLKRLSKQAKRHEMEVPTAFPTPSLFIYGQSTTSQE